MKRKLRIAGLDCPACAAELESELAKIEKLWGFKK